MGTCAMTIIHHRLSHPGITAELQHRPADVGHAARTVEAETMHPHPPPPTHAASQMLPPPHSLAQQSNTGQRKSPERTSLIIGTRKHTYVSVH